MKECSSWSLNILTSVLYRKDKYESKIFRTCNYFRHNLYRKGEIYEAKDDGDFIMIRMEDDSTVKAPKSEIEGILEVIEENA